MERVEAFIESRRLPWRVHRVGRPVKTVGQAAAALGVPERKIVKTIVLIDGGRTFACILPGNRRLDTGKLRATVGGSPRMASPREVLERTGYRVGGVPPYPLPGDVTIVIDRRVLELDKAYGGGGDEYSLLEFRPRDLAVMSNAIVADISA